MNFKEIRLTGFKSFADKTSIVFDDGVTCIVGPNGCGKSNVADAVRWVLGEQSPKNLRGTNMQDVIFNGSEARRALSFCEVTLVFDNTNRIFDIEYDEVSMTRRLYRSGESEYLLNMQTCRLRDIVALLHGVGIGKEGYSIIGQGRVEQIMNAKPEDRRSIFEEATGVMKFKSQKAEIERKLQNASDNMIVFVQRMDEAERQLKPLERQAETAKKYRAYSDQLKYEEVNTYLARYENFASETERQRSVIDRVNIRLNQVEGEFTALETEENDMRGRIAANDDTLRALNDKLRTFEVGLEHKSGEARVIGERIASYKRQLTNATEDTEYSLRRTREIDQLTLEGNKKAEADRARAQSIERRCAELSKKAEELDTRLTLFERISDEKRASELSSVEDLADVRASVGSLSAQQTAVSERLDEVRIAIAKTEERRKEYSAQYESCKKEKAECVAFLDAKDGRAKELTENMREINVSAQKLTQELMECNTSIANLNNNLELYVSLKNRFDGYRDSVRKLQLTAQREEEVAKRIKGTIADIVSTNQKYEVAIETAFGGAMQNIVTSTADDARYLIEYLKKNNIGIVTFLPVEAMRPHGNTAEIRKALSERGALGLADELVRYNAYYENVIGNLLGNTLVCDNIANATAISKKYPRSFRIVTLDGDIIATSGAMTGGSRRKDSGNLLAGERRIKECEEGIKRKQALLEKLKKAIEDCEREREEANAEYEAFRIRVQEQTASFAVLSEKEITLRELLEESARDLAEYKGLLERLERRADDLESEVLTSTENEGLLHRIRSEAAAEIAARTEEAGKLKSERDGVREELHNLRVERAAIESAQEAEKENLRRLQEEKEALLKKVEETRVAIANTENLISKLREEEERVALTEEEQKAVASIRAQIASTEKEKRETGERQTKLAEKKRALLAEQQNLTDKKHESELEISRTETNLENMKQRIDEAYGLSYESARELRDEHYDITQSYTNINSLKHKISALGPVNQNAEADYDALLERYTEMQTQKSDLEKGISDLTGVLNDLRSQMQQQFDKGFNEINANFTKIFKELFGGGKAYMELDYTDCDDPLNAGIEIVACPPGKKLAKISLLSGGERALTAIAILFSILKSRPMPFCILDEIEAALDEANVDRFADYLKKFSKETQFIVITHRKPTMTRADILFGVTMEEQGVSKIVSVKLSEIEEKLGGDTVIS